MASKYWIKLYHEILEDPKMGRLPDRIWRRAIELFLLAGDLNNNGTLPPVRDIAWRLRMSEQALWTDFEELKDAGIIEESDEGEWVVTNFAKRQGPVSNARRIQEHRKAQRVCNDSETNGKRLCNDGAHSDTDRDRDKEEEADREVEADPLPLLCPIHQVELTRFTKGEDVWHSHRQGDGWCKPKLPRAAPDPQSFISGKFGESIRR